jgi:gliding motility-associated-like protein
LETYKGYGLPDTWYARLVDSLKVIANAGKDVLSCNKEPVQLGANSIPGLAYQWSPTAGLSSSTISNPQATPDATTKYVLTTSHDGGGCASNDTVVVTASIIDNSLGLKGKDMYCSDSGDSAVLGVVPTDKMQWYKDGRIVAGAIQSNYHVKQSGAYYAYLINKDGCSIATTTKNIVIDDPKPPIRYPDVFAIINYPLNLSARKFGDTAKWSPGIYLDTRVTYTPVFKGPSEQLYTIEIKSKSGCVTVDTQMVKTIKNADIYVPNAFTPNGNGRNDYLHPILRGIKELHYFRVYNRWGQLVFESKENGKGWDGRVNGVLQGQQVVVWLVEGVGIDNQIYMRKGTTVIVR